LFRVNAAATVNRPASQISVKQRSIDVHAFDCFKRFFNACDRSDDFRALIGKVVGLQKGDERLIFHDEKALSSQFP
jgi:hypothetical protein